MHMQRRDQPTGRFPPDGDRRFYRSFTTYRAVRWSDPDDCLSNDFAIGIDDPAVQYGQQKGFQRGFSEKTADGLSIQQLEPEIVQSGFNMAGICSEEMFSDKESEKPLIFLMDSNDCFFVTASQLGANDLGHFQIVCMSRTVHLSVV